VVEAVTRSAFWSNTVIFVIEDDPQSGYDHVDAPYPAKFVGGHGRGLKALRLVLAKSQKDLDD
jgi:phospholipase C